MAQMRFPASHECWATQSSTDVDLHDVSLRGQKQLRLWGATTVMSQKKVDHTLKSLDELKVFEFLRLEAGFAHIYPRPFW
jgi:hypothetical protein